MLLSMYHNCHARSELLQDGKSLGLPEGVHGLYEPVIGHHRLRNSLITFVILSQIPCGKVHKKPSYFSAQDCVKVSPRFAAVFQITWNN